MRSVSVLLALLSVGCRAEWSFEDADGDGFTWLQGDCDDSNPTIFPSADEVCDSIDNNCNGITDGADASDGQIWYGDKDGDGYTGTELSLRSCQAPAGYNADPTDCDDGNSAIFPGATEYCNDVDDDCDGEVDEDDAFNGTTYYADSDGDGYGDPKSTAPGCSPPDGFVADSTDCDDSADTIHPGAAESCNKRDDDCNGEVDESGGASYYLDSDGDGYGRDDDVVVTCTPADDRVAEGGDCDDDDDTTYPGSTALEVPDDGVDADCDGKDYCTDLDCNGQPELVIPVLTADGSSDFSPKSLIGFSSDLSSTASLTTSGAAHALARDFNKDGYLDLVFASLRDNSSCASDSLVFWGNGAGVDSSPDALPTISAEDVAVEDIDGNGYLDLVFSSRLGEWCKGASEGAVLVYWGIPSGFRADNVSEVMESGASRVDVVDLDDDGALDILACVPEADGTAETSSVILWGNGKGGFDSRTELDTVGCTDQAAADLDDDGLLDVVFANGISDDGTSPPSYVYTNDGGRFASPVLQTLTTTAAASVTVVDLDADGSLDLLFGSAVEAPGSDAPLWELDAQIFWGSGGSFSDGDVSTLPGNGSAHPAAADLDGDGLVDVVLPGYHSDDGYPWEDGVYTQIDSYIYWGADAYDTSTRTALTTTGAWRAATADFDEDGYLEIVLAGFYDGEDYGPGSVVYWGSAEGYADSNTTSLKHSGVWGELLVAGE